MSVIAREDKGKVEALEWKECEDEKTLASSVDKRTWWCQKGFEKRNVDETTSESKVAGGGEGERRTLTLLLYQHGRSSFISGFTK